LQANASNGRTGVFVNGRQLPHTDLMVAQQQAGPIPPGQYWCRANGDCGQQGSQQVLINLAPKSKSSNNGNGMYWNNDSNGSTYISGDGSCMSASSKNVDGSTGSTFYLGCD